MIGSYCARIFAVFLFPVHVVCVNMFTLASLSFLVFLRLSLKVRRGLLCPVNAILVSILQLLLSSVQNPKEVFTCNEIQPVTEIRIDILLY